MDKTLRRDPYFAIVMEFQIKSVIVYLSLN